MEPYNQAGWGCGPSGRDDVVINTPVTIAGEGGGRRNECGPGMSVNELAQYTARIVLQSLQGGGPYPPGPPWGGGEWPWGGGGGPWPPGGGPWNNVPQGPYPPVQPFGNMKFAAINQGVNSPFQVIGNVPFDGQYIINAGLVCKTANGAAGTQTLTITYFDITAGLTTITITQTLSALGESNLDTVSGNHLPYQVMLLGGSIVTVTCTQGGTYSGATYDAFVGLLKTS